MRQAKLASSAPVAQRASVRLAKELKIIDKSEVRAEIAAAALVERFKEPLEEMDIDGLAILTRLDRKAILGAADKANAARVATKAH
jgi:hypothetical protein